MTSKFLNRAAVAVSLLVFLWALPTIGWVQAFGWVYSLAFALSAIPEAAKSIKNGYTGTADGTILLWIIGEIAGVIYGIGISQFPIIFNCGMNTLFVGIIVKYRLWPRNKDEIDS